MNGCSRQILGRQAVNSAVLLLIDSLIIVLGLYLGKLIVFGIYDIPIYIKYSILVVPVWCIGAVVSGQMPGWGLGAVEELRRIQLLLAVVFGLAGLAYFLSAGGLRPSRIVYLTSFLFSAVAMPFGRVFCRRVLGQMKAWGCDAVLYGDPLTVGRILDVLRSETVIGYCPVGIYSDELEMLESFQGVPVLGGLREATKEVPVAIASIAHLSSGNLTEFVDHILADYHKVVLFPDISEGVFAWVTPRNFGGLIGLEVSRNLLYPLASIIKRLYEAAFVLFIAPVWVPVMLVCALMVYLKDGQSPFYAQERVGRNGKRFKALKLRTMVPNADQVLDGYLDAHPALKAEWEASHKLKEDPRITGVGYFLRRFSLDELPQFIHVLRGQMALVGPRPLPVYHDEALSESARQLRGRVLPGLTGLWQVSGRSDCSRDEMEQWDSFYVRNWSVWLDLYIITRTMRAVLFSSGAY